MTPDQALRKDLVDLDRLIADFDELEDWDPGWLSARALLAAIAADLAEITQLPASLRMPVESTLDVGLELRLWRDAKGRPIYVVRRAGRMLTACRDRSVLETIPRP